jgi:hypothetical protein
MWGINHCFHNAIMLITVVWFCWDFWLIWPLIS